MAKTVTKKSPKEPIRLRTKALSDGSQSLYLDYYIDGKRSYEFLKLYLLPGSSAKIKAQNEATMNAANTIKLQRILEYTNNKAGLKNTSIKAKQRLRDWMETFRKAQEKKGIKDKKLIHNTIHAISQYNIDIAMKDIDRNYCIGLTNFLRNEYRMANGELIKPYTAINYLACLRNALNMAVREDVIPTNPLQQLSVQDKIKAPESKREFLTIEEVQRLEATPCDHELIKSAFLFGCYCGLRISDIRRLKWSDLLKEGDSYRINIIMHKTQAPIYIPLSKKAVNWIPERKDMSEDALLFPGLPEQVSAPQYLTPWMKAAGITKPITFHSSRHSFATMMLTLDVDLYTVSKLLGHTKVETTQIYAKIINKKKDDAVSLIDAAFDKMQDSTQSKAI
jgi:integrase